MDSATAAFQIVPPRISSYDNPGLTFDDDVWDEATLPPRPWVAPGHLMRGSVTVYTGGPGVSKSSLMVSCASALVLGVPFGKFRPVQPCKVLTYNVEDDQDEQRRRFSAAMRHFGRPISDLAGKLTRVGAERIGTLLGEKNNSFGPLPAMDELKLRIEAFEPDVVILDPLVELHDRDENDNTEVRRVMAHFRSIAVKHNLALVLLHHTRKGTAAAAGDPESARGASAVIGAARIVLTVTTMSEPDAQAFGISVDNRHHYFRVDEGKANYSALGSADWFEKIVHVLDNGDAVMAPAPWMLPVDVVTPDKRIAIEADVAIGSAVGPWAAKLSKDARSIRTLFSQYGVSTAKGQQSLLDDLLLHGFEVATFRRANRATAQGIRTADGRPSNFAWVRSDDDSD
jgi:hypothetical protein